MKKDGQKKLHRILDFLADKRFPWFFLKYIQNYLESPNKEIKSLKVALTFDVEENYPSKSASGVSEFLDNIINLLRDESIEATFFVQAALVPKIHRQLYKLQEMGNEIGIHGFDHNNWGTQTWFWNEHPLTTEEKKRDLKKSRAVFKKYKIKPPIIFRAPNMNANEETLAILSENGFSLDSSWPSFREPLMETKRFKNLTVVPVSATYRPRFVINGFPHFDFQVFNMANLSRYKGVNVRDYLADLLYGQKKPNKFMVFLTHPWEFYKNDMFTYCSEKNYAVFKHLILELKSKFSAKFVTVSQI